jgi:hypothetical protein
MTIRSHRSFAALAFALAVPALVAVPVAAQTDTTGNDVVPRTRSDPGGTSTFGSPMGGPGAGPGAPGIGSGTGRAGATGDVAPGPGSAGATVPPGVVMDRPTPAPRGAMTPTRPVPSSGATTTGPLGTGSAGPAQSTAGRLDDEAARTALLNRFGGLGFAALESFRRTGGGYEAEVRTITGERMTVDIDPRTGEVMTRR